MSVTSLLLSFCNPAPGRDADFNEWHDVHLREVVECTRGIRWAGRYELNPIQRWAEAFLPEEGSAEAEPEQLVLGRESPWKCLAVLEVEGDIAEMYADIDRHRDQLTPDGGSRDAAHENWVFEPLGERVESPMSHVVPGTQKHLWVALTNPAEGREDDFNEWYDLYHVPEITAVQLGGVTARRYKLNPAQSQSGSHAWKYLALFERQGDDVEAMHRGDAAYRLDGRRTPSNGAVDPDYALWVYTAVPTYAEKPVQGASPA